MAANAERGEVEVSVGGRRLMLAVTMDGLARVSSAIGAKGLDDITQRLTRHEPNAVRAAVEYFATVPDTGRKAVSEMKPADLFSAAAACLSALVAAFDDGGASGNAGAAGENS